jgi:hypothetical protein
MEDVLDWRKVVDATDDDEINTRQIKGYVARTRYVRGPCLPCKELTRYS